MFANKIILRGSVLQGQAKRFCPKRAGWLPKFGAFSEKRRGRPFYFRDAHRSIYLTTGPSRLPTVGNQVIRLKHISPRKILLADRPAGIALTALWYLGKEQVNVSVIEKIRRKLPVEEFEALKALPPSMPGWMVKAFQEHEGTLRHD